MSKVSKLHRIQQITPFGPQKNTHQVWSKSDEWLLRYEKEMHKYAWIPFLIVSCTTVVFTIVRHISQVYSQSHLVSLLFPTAMKMNVIFSILCYLQYTSIGSVWEWIFVSGIPLLWYFPCRVCHYVPTLSPASPAKILHLWNACLFVSLGCQACMKSSLLLQSRVIFPFRCPVTTSRDYMIGVWYCQGDTELQLDPTKHHFTK